MKKVSGGDNIEKYWQSRTEFIKTEKKNSSCVDESIARCGLFFKHALRIACFVSNVSVALSSQAREILVAIDPPEEFSTPANIYTSHWTENSWNLWRSTHRKQKKSIRIIYCTW